jgi:hypothetical protein
VSPWLDEGGLRNRSSNSDGFAGCRRMVRCRSRGLVRVIGHAAVNRRGAGSRSARGGVALDYGNPWAELPIRTPVAVDAGVAIYAQQVA